MNLGSATTRAQFLKSAFPQGIPTLWCPPLTHYQRDGAIDAERIAFHLRHLFPSVGGFLIPGSTGDGWELTQTERREVIAVGIEQARQLNAQVLIGALHPDSNEALNLIVGDIEWLKSRCAERDPAAALAKAHICGFTICPPRGKGLIQEEIQQKLSSILQLGLPTAIYQLPQVTLNEMSPELTSDLAQRFENFIFFKDTSGADSVALSRKDLAGVFTARGAEGDYARWLKAAGGPYDGFLLSSANCFARQLRQMISDIDADRLEAARELSARIAAAVSEVFGLVSKLPDGNPFANGNKAIDHFFAHGPEALEVLPPRLHAGSSLPPEVIRSTGQILLNHELMPVKGYLE